MWTLFTVILEAYARIQGFYDFTRKREHHIWQIVDSTKDLEAGERKVRRICNAQSVIVFRFILAGARGTAVHTDLENLCKGKVVKQTEANEGLLRWWETRNLTKNDILASELFLMSPKLGYAGTLDVVYVDPTDGATVLADLKTGYVSWTAFVQNNAYKDLADEQELFGGIDRVSVIHVRPVSEGKLMYGWEELVADTVTTETWRHILAIFNTLPVSIKEYQEDE